MAVERWQLRGNRANDHLRRAAAQAISLSDATDGRRSAHRRAGVSTCGLCLGPESPDTVTVQPLMRRLQPDEHVRVSVDQGAVVLRGFVFSDSDLQQAVRTAGKVAGDRRVIDNLSIKQGGRR